MVDSLAQPPDVTFGLPPSSEYLNSGMTSMSFGSCAATLAPGGSCTEFRPYPPSPGLPLSLPSSAAAASVRDNPVAPSAAEPQRLRRLKLAGARWCVAAHVGT